MASFPFIFGGLGSDDVSGFHLDTMTLGNVSLPQTFRAMVFFPPGGLRLLAKTFQPVITFTGTDIKIRQIGLRMRPIMRRPGGSGS